MNANFRLLDQIIAKEAIDGIYYGPKVQVLLQCGEKGLIWVPGHSTWSGTGQPWRYAPSEMFITHEGARDPYKRLGGGRLKKALIEHAERIDQEFGEGISKLIDPAKTLIIGND